MADGSRLKERATSRRSVPDSWVNRKEIFPCLPWPKLSAGLCLAFLSTRLNTGTGDRRWCGPDGFSDGALRCVGSGAGRVPLVSLIRLDSEPTRALSPARSQHWPDIMNEMWTISRDSAALAGRSARWRGTSQRLGVFSVLSQQLAEPQAQSLIRERGEKNGSSAVYKSWQRESSLGTFVWGASTVRRDCLQFPRWSSWCRVVAGNSSRFCPGRSQETS